jgi:hypothetical protein
MAFLFSRSAMPVELGCAGATDFRPSASAFAQLRSAL